jgi:hypothetical protein
MAEKEWIPVDKFQSKKTVMLMELISMPIHTPELQRPLSYDRMQDIVAYQMDAFQKCQTFCFLGDLVMCDTGNNSLLLVDGQHRYEAIKQIYMHQPTYQISITKLANISLEVAFLLLNKAQPVPQYIIDSVFNLSRKTFLESFSRLLKKEFGHYITKSINPRRPNVKIDHILDTLSKSEVWDVCHALTNVNYCFKCFLHINTNYLTKMETPIGNNERIMSKAQKYLCSPLYLSNDVDDIWPSLLVKAHADFLAQEIAAKALDKKNENIPSKSLPKAVRMAAWNKWFFNTAGGCCFICKSPIDISRFECGHIISRYNGGSDNVNNLRPICGLCNKSMGKQNMSDFCKSYGVNF